MDNQDLICPITLIAMTDPVIDPEGNTFERSAIERWVREHGKSPLTNSHLTLSIKNGNLLLGTWQGIYLFEHRLSPTKRIIIHHFLGT